MIFLLLIFVTIFYEGGGLRDVQVLVPEVVVSGSTISLHCSYDLEDDSLYSVKWYKGRREFFRYVPREVPHTRVFPLPGLDVDVSKSGASGVVLRSVASVASGRYRCEVSADAPSFHTAMKTSHMQVVDLPKGAPEVATEKLRLSPGDILTAKCTAPAANPAANLTWLLNGKTVNVTRTQTTPGVSVLSVNVSKETVGQGSVRLTCKATVYKVYSAQAELVLAAAGQRPTVLLLAASHTNATGMNILRSPLIVILLYQIIGIIR